MSFLDAILPVGDDGPCQAPAARAEPYTQTAGDAWTARCDVCGGKVKYERRQDADAAAGRHNATGEWDPVPDD